MGCARVEGKKLLINNRRSTNWLLDCGLFNFMYVSIGNRFATRFFISALLFALVFPPQTIFALTEAATQAADQPAPIAIETEQSSTPVDIPEESPVTTTTEVAVEEVVEIEKGESEEMTDSEAAALVESQDVEETIEVITASSSGLASSTESQEESVVEVSEVETEVEEGVTIEVASSTGTSTVEVAAVEDLESLVDETETTDDRGVVEAVVENVVEFFTGTERVQSALELAAFVDGGRVTPIVHVDDTYIGTSTATTLVVYGATFNGDFIFEERATGLEAQLPSGLSVQTANSDAFDVTALGIEVLEDGSTTAGKAGESFKFGIEGQHLVFSAPVALTLPTELADGTQLSVRVTHAGQGEGTDGITMNPDAVCTAGVSDDENNQAVVQSGQVTFYTCGASTFVLDPDGDTVDEAVLWLQANSGVGSVADADPVASWQGVGSGDDYVQATTSAQPSYVNNSADNFNYNPVVRFDGDDDLRFAEDLLTDGATEYTILSVHESTANEGTIVSSGFNINGGDQGVTYTVGLPTSGGIGASQSIVFSSGDRTSNSNPSIRASNNSFPINQTHLATAQKDGLTGVIRKNGDGLTVAGNGLHATVEMIVDDVTRIGSARGDSTWAPFFNGDLAELIVYEDTLSGTELLQVESYLALKYGLTLASTTNNYLDSTNVSVYDLSTGYENDVVGLGRDDAMTLDQRVSHSAEVTAVLTVATDNDFVTENASTSRTQLADGQYLVIGHDGGVTNGTTTTDAPANATRVPREWHIENSGTVGEVHLQFDGFDDSWALLTDADGDFTSGASSVPLSATGEVAVTLADESYFTLAQVTVAPGGVDTDLALWLRADAGLNETDGQEVDAWVDQSGSGNDVSEATNRPMFQNNTTDNLNFNPTIAFDGTNEILTTTNTNILAAKPGVDAYVVTNLSSSQDNFSRFISEEASGAGNRVFMMGHAEGPDRLRALVDGGATGAARFDLFEPTPSFGNTRLYQARFDGAATTMDLIVNGETVINNTIAGGTTTRAPLNRPLSIGSSAQSPSTAAEGQISEVIIYDAASADATDRQKIESYLALKYGITKASHAYTVDAPGMTFLSTTALDRINDGNISTSTAGGVIDDYQVHPNNAVGKTITMTFADPVSIAEATFYNRTQSSQANSDRIVDAQMIYKDEGGATLYTHTFIAPASDEIAVADPAGVIANVKTVELTNFQSDSQNFREISFSSIPGPTAYADSAGNAVFTYDSVYQNDIVGIARDDASALDQRVSKSVNDDAVLTIATDNDFISPNTDAGRTSLTDGQYLVIGHDGGATTTQTTELDTGVYAERTIREWRVENTNSVAPVWMQFDGFDDTWELLLSFDGDFSNVTSGLQLSATGTRQVSLADGIHVTLAKLPQAPTAGPGGVTGDLALWLKASDVASLGLSGSNVQTWTDQAQGLVLTDDAAADPQYVTNSTDFNFNPSVDFTANTTQLTATTDTLIGVDDDSVSYYAVTKASGSTGDREVVFIYKNGNIDATDSAGGTSDGTIGLELNGSAFVNDSGDTISTSGVNTGIHLSSVVSDTGLDRDYYLDGFLAGSDNVAVNREGNSTEHQLSVGSYGGEGNPFNGELAELIVYDETSTTSDRQQIESYLALKYGITLDPVAEDYVDSIGNSVFDLGFNEIRTGAEATDNTGGSGLPDGATLGGSITITTPGTYTVTHSATIGLDGSGAGFGIRSTPYVNGENAAGLTAEVAGASSDVFTSSANRINTASSTKSYAVTFPSAGDYYIGFFSGGSNTASAHTLTVIGGNQYTSDVFGLGYDATSTLDQRVSGSVNDTAVLTIATDNNFASANTATTTRTQLADGQYLVIGHNGEATTTQTTDLNTVLYGERTVREWRAENTNGVGPVHLQFDGFDDTWVLLTDADGDFSTGATNAGTLDVNGEITDVTLTDGMFFTLATLPAPAGPGGVTDDLQFWVKADSGVFSDIGATDAIDTGAVQTWYDQSAVGNNLNQPIAGSQPTYVARAVNFNPAVAFSTDSLPVDSNLDGTSDDAIMGNLTGTNAYEVFSVVTDVSNAGSPIYLGNAAGTIDLVHAYDLRTPNIVGIRDNSGNYFDTIAANGGSTADPHLYNWRTPSSGQFQDMVITVDAGSNTFSSQADQTEVTNLTGNRIQLGASRNSSAEQFNSNSSISETIIYDAPLSATDRQQIESYLAIKYGITLDSAVGDYLDSTGTSTYDLSTGYTNDVFGIGYDATSTLDQRVSKSVNDGAVVTIATDNDFITENASTSRTSLSNGQYLVIGNNGSDTTATTTDLNAVAYAERTEREWRVENTGGVAPVHMQFDGYDDTWEILLSFDGDFSNVTSGLQLSATGTRQVSLSDGIHFTLAKLPQAPTVVPGGVSAGLTLWLDADDASTLYQETGCTNQANAGDGVGCWQDKSGQGHDVTGTAEPVVVADDLNGRTVLDFAGDSLVTAGGGQITTNSGYTKFAVVQFDGTGSNNIISSSPGTHAFWGNGGTQISMWHSGTFITSANLGTAQYQIGTGRYGVPDGETNVINVDGAEAASNNTTRNFTATGQITRIGSHGTGNNLNGQLAEAIIYDRALTDDEIDAVECYLSGKWGIEVSSGCQIIVSTTTLSVAEPGGTNTFTVQLGEEPTDDVTLTVTSGDFAEATTSPTTLTFTNANWDTPQTVTVTGIDDTNPGDDTTTVTIAVDAALSDDEFDLAPEAGVAVTLVSDEQLPTPGGVSAGLAVWLKADEGVTGAPITNWQNNIAAGTDDPIIVGTPDFTAESINFNPAASFEGVSTLEYINFGNIVNGWTAGQAFMVGMQDSENVVNGNETGHWRIGGNSNSHVTWTNELIYESFGNSSRINAITTPYSTHIPHLYSASHSDTDQANLYWNGENIHSSVRATRFANEPVWLARNRGGGRYQGDIPEFILFDTALSAPEQQRVDSYLALKYGLTLDQTTATDYLASDGTTQMWDADLATAATYGNDIAGIGRDDGSALGQIKSRSVSEDALVTIEAEGEGTNASNSFADMDDLEFLMWGNDDASIDSGSTQVPAGLPGAAAGRFTRVWQAQHEGDVGAVTVSFDLGDQSLFNIATNGDYALLLDTDGDFSDATVYTTGAAINGDEISFTGVTLTDGMYFSLAGPPKPAPGGVGAAIWLRADAGTDTTVEGAEVTTWNDQANNHDAIGSGTTRPTYQNDAADQLNFNPTLRFDGSDDFLGITRNFPERNYSHFVVYNTTDAGGSLSAIVSPVAPGAGPVDRNFSLSGARLHHRLWSEQRIVGDTGLNDGLSHIAGVTVENGIGQTLYSDGTQVASGSKDFSNFTWDAGMVLGNNRYHGALEGDIAEVLFFDSALSATDHKQVESYLAIKYGVTLDQTTANDYRASNGAVLFDAAGAMNGYRNDIAGIGVDDAGGLTQPQSRSQNDDGIVTVGNASSLENMDFLLWGNDDVSLTQITSNMPAGLTSRTARTWRFEETNDVGTVDVSFDTASLGVYNSSAAGYVLMTDGDADFTDAVTVSGSTLINGVVTFTGVAVSDGQFFTLGVLPVNIGDRLWSDLDGDGIDDGGAEIGLADITVQLFNDDGANLGVYDGDETLVGTVITSADGAYDFAGLPGGDYLVVIEDAAGWLAGALQTGGGTNPELINTIVGDDINDADYGYRLTPPPVTDGNISINSGSGTSGTFIVGDTLTVTWDASNTGDNQPHPLREVVADLSAIGGAAQTIMTDTTACGGTAGDGIYEACVSYSVGVFDVTNANVTVTASNIGATTGPVADSTNIAVDNQPPLFTTSNVSISTDNGPLDVAAVNGGGINPDAINVNAVLDLSDGDTITWDASSLGGSAVQANNAPVTLVAGSLDDDAVVFGVTATDNAGNTVTYTTAEIDDVLLAVDTVVPTVDLEQVSAQDDPTAFDSATFEVTFSEEVEVSSFTSASVSLTGTTGAVTGGPTAQSATTYQFTVTGMTSDETITAALPTGVVRDSAGNASLASVSVDNQVTFDNEAINLTIDSPTFGATVASTTAVSGSCDAGGVVSVTSADLVTNPTTVSCIGGSYSTTIEFLPSASEVVLGISQIDEFGNTGPTASTTVTVDADGDGSSSALENAGNNGGDGNGDGIPDSVQSNVAGTPNPVTGEYTTLETVGTCTFITENAAVAEDSLTALDPTYDYPLGLVDFQVLCPTAGASTTVTVYYGQEYDTSDWVWRKFDGDGNEYSDISTLVTYGTDELGSPAGTTTVTVASFVITDGDPTTDEDGVADGVINDPSGPGISLDSGGSSGTRVRSGDEGSEEAEEVEESTDPADPITSEPPTGEPIADPTPLPESGVTPTGQWPVLGEPVSGAEDDGDQGDVNTNASSTDDGEVDRINSESEDESVDIVPIQADLDQAAVDCSSKFLIFPLCWPWPIIYVIILLLLTGAQIAYRQYAREQQMGS